MENEGVREEILQGKMLSIGFATRLQLQFESTGGELKFAGILLGMAPEEYLIIRIPAIAGIRDSLREGRQMIVRYLFSGVLYGFTTSVLHSISKPNLIVFLSYPRIIETLNLRKARRVDSLLPSVTQIDDKEFWGVVTDISTGGCRFVLEGSESDLGAFQVGRDLDVFIQLAGVAEHQIIRGTIKNALQGAGRAEIGIQFDESNVNVMSNVYAYISNVLNIEIPVVTAGKNRPPKPDSDE